MQRIVTIGGGTGHYQLLRGLKNYNLHLDALVSVMDNGGSSGILREEMVDFGILPPGDIRNCLLALTDESKLSHMVALFNYRFPETGKSISKHNLGNLIIAACQDLYGKNEGIPVVSSMLGIKNSRVIPISVDATNIYAKTRSGKTLEGQLEVSYPPQKEEIIDVWLLPNAFINKIAVEAINASQLIVICPGDLFGSIIPNFLVKGLNEAIEESQAKIIYVCNLVTKQGTYGFKASDFVKEIEKYLSRRIDYVICNTKRLTKEVVDKYKNENSEFVEPDYIKDKKIIKENLLIQQEVGGKILARHDPQKTARIIMEILEDNFST